MKLEISGKFGYFILWVLCQALVLPTMAQNYNTQDCETTDSNGTTTSFQACLADAEVLYNLNILATVEPADYTCGYGQNERENVYCTLDISRECSLCDATNDSLSHPPEYSYDQQSQGQPTWWQSVTWYNYPTPLEITLTLSLNHSYTLNSDISIIFQSSLPRRMILEKSSDNGQTWQPYQYYAYSCGYFQMTHADVVTTPTEVICSESYSSGPQTALYPNGEVLFTVQERLSLLTSSPFPQDFAVAYDNATDLKAFLEVTDLRLRLLYPATDGSEWTHQFESLIHYYYAVSNIDVFLICNCNLHGKFCYMTSNQETVCQCSHNTMGKNCEHCLPLYNNRPWAAGSALPYPGGTANECEKCTCNEHSDRCTYDASLGHGVCDDCTDNTAGFFCEICINGYHRNISVAASSPDSCIECDCEPVGTVVNGTSCSQYSVDGKPVGQCNCIDNVEGRACDVCVDEYYGLLVEEQLGTCRDCSCNRLGTINASNVCEKQAGACPCKQSTDTRTCGECKDGYYGYPTTETEECSLCGCNVGGSTSLVCNKVSGRCSCRSNITDRQCSVTDQGFYFEFLDSNSYDSWEATSDCVPTSDVPFDLFTGAGFQTCYQGNQVTFRGVTAATGQSNESYYRPAIRYTYASTSPWQQANLNVVVAQSDTNSSLCPMNANTPISTLALSLPPGTATAWYASEGEALRLDQRCQYNFSLTLNARGQGAQEIEIDALVILPVVTSFSVYTQADSSMMAFYGACISNMTAMATRRSAIDQCWAFMFAVSAEVNDGALVCDCDPTGSISSSCTPYGGGCMCKNGVGGQRCDRCLPGYYGFTAQGCTPCICDTTGSLSQACDYNTGQCPCKAGIALTGQLNNQGTAGGLQCRNCLANHYGFSMGGGCLPCNCNEDGSSSLQCSETGACTCKETITGIQCNNCLPDYFLFSANGCTPCNCNPDGSNSSSCHPTQGTCNCKPNTQGVQCDRCRLGYFNLQPANPDGCQPCFCHNHGSQCSAAPSYVASTIADDFTDGRFPPEPSHAPTPHPPTTPLSATQPPAPSPVTPDPCTPPPPCLPPFPSCACINDLPLTHTICSQSASRWTATEPSAVTVTSDSIRVSHPATSPSAAYVYLLAPSAYLGQHLDLYSQRFSYTMKLDTGTVDTTSSQYLIVTGGRSNIAVYYSDEEFIPGLMGRQFQATFYESKWRVVGSEREPTVSEFQEILSAITSIRIRASFGAGTASTFYNVSMDTAQYVTNPEDFTTLVTTMEQCSCNAATNTMGLSCEQCQPATFRQNSVDMPFDVCVPCDCNGRATSCDPVTGVCLGCQLGTVGDHCENCAANVQEPSCDRCLPNYYGFGTELFGGACSPCTCNMTGTGGATQCVMQTGQCPCTGNYGGMLCDSCQLNYYNYVLGCLPCDMCYDSISSEYTDLVTRATNLTNFLVMLRAANMSTTLGSFYARLTSAHAQTLQLVETTNAVINEGDDLTVLMMSLNTTMHQLLASLEGTIKSGLESADQSLMTTDELIGQALQAILGVEQALIGAYNGLTSSDIQSIQTILSQLNIDLNSIQSQLGSVLTLVDSQEALLTHTVSNLTQLAGSTVQTTVDALLTVQRAQSVHDNTTAHTAALVTKANQVSDLDQQTQQAVSEVKQRSEEAKTAGEDGTQAELSAQISELASNINGVIETAMTKSTEAVMTEALAGAQQVANNHIITEVTETGTQTASLIADVNTTLNDVNARYDRALKANQSKSQAVMTSDTSFTAAEEMLDIVQNFASQSLNAQTAADDAFRTQSDIEALITQTVATAIALRNQLIQVSSDAQEGLSKASEAFTTAQAEGQSIDSVNHQAIQLAQESAVKLQDTNQTSDSVRAVNTSQLQPAKAACDTYAPQLQNLETRVTQANADAQTAADGALNTQATVDRLLEEVRNIQQADLSALPGLMERIQQARATFTQGEFTQLVASLSTSVQEQQAWLEAAQAQAAEMESQIDALDSFRV